MAAPSDAEVARLARQIAELGAGLESEVFHMSWWSERMLGWAMSHPGFKTQLFRFVDVFPATTDADDVLGHIHEYFQGEDAPRIVGMAAELADHVPFGENLSASVARRNITRMAQQFIVGASPSEAVEGLHRLWRQGSAFTCDLLGEKTVTEAEADRYEARVHELLDALESGTRAWAPDDHLEFDDRGPLPRVNVSVKPTALASQYAPLTREIGIDEAKTRLRRLLQRAARDGAFVYLDMEHYDVKDLTLQVFRELLDEPELALADAGVVIQAYLKDSYHDLADLISWARRRPHPIGVRLVKGAYWDSETVQAHAEGWPSPVFETKAETDASYERCVRLLHDNHDAVRPAFASHNLRSLAYAISYARAQGISDTAYEIQMLYGMAEPIHAAIRRLGMRLRVYAPVGELVPGMAYLVRRLLENTSNESFVRMRFAEERSLDELIAPPAIDGPLPDPAPDLADPAPATDAQRPGPYEHEPPLEFRRAGARAAMRAAVNSAASSRAIDVPGIIDGEEVRTGDVIESRDPADLDRLVGRSASLRPDDADRAVAGALAAFPEWSDRSVEQRAAVLFGAAAWMREHRVDLVALEVFEAGKPWREADADVCEAIDFCEYYGRQMLELAAGGAVLSPPGESNRLDYRGRGVTAVISPWNFPLAIPTGLVVSALVAGNTVVFKPAEQTPAMAWQLVRALLAGGAPDGALQLVPGIGEDVGAHLVAHPDVANVSFTGSMAVGLSIVEAAGARGANRRHVKRVIAEMGGKNALLVDDDADLDQVVPAVLYAAFGYAGQKCSAASRLIVLDAVYDRLLPRLVGAAAELRVGHPADMAVQVGPVIDAEAHAKVMSYIELAPSEGEVVFSHADVPAIGHFAPPTIVGHLSPTSRIATEEIFGPVLSVFRARDLDHAIALANDTPYALTAGVFSRSPRNLLRASRELRAGNVYLNRGTTGSIVGRQPFGGYGLSGVGAKAGGPDYLLQLCDSRVVTENTLRQGFAPGLERLK